MTVASKEDCSCKKGDTVGGHSFLMVCQS
jgi:hypothetical protein